MTFPNLTYVHYSRRASRNFVFDSKTLFSFLGGVGLLSVKTPHILNFHVSKTCIGKCSDSFTYSLNFYTKYIMSKLKKHWDVEQYLYNDENVVARIFSTLSFTWFCDRWFQTEPLIPFIITFAMKININDKVYIGDNVMIFSTVISIAFHKSILSGLYMLPLLWTVRILNAKLWVWC